MKFMHICWTNWHVEIHVHFCFGATSFIYSPHWYNNAHFSVFISTKISTLRLFISTIKRGNVLFGRFQNSYGAVWVCKTNLWHQNWRFFDDWFDSSMVFYATISRWVSSWFKAKHQKLHIMIQGERKNQYWNKHEMATRCSELKRMQSKQETM